jgi:hypothetical protein
MKTGLDYSLTVDLGKLETFDELYRFEYVYFYRLVYSSALGFAFLYTQTTTI